LLENVTGGVYNSTEVRPMQKNCAIYTRVSTEEQAAEGVSLDMQERSCREAAAKLGFTVTAVFKDEGISAFSRKPRPAGLPREATAGVAAGGNIDGLCRVAFSRVKVSLHSQKKRPRADTTRPFHDSGMTTFRLRALSPLSPPAVPAA